MEANGYQSLFSDELMPTTPIGTQQKYTKKTDTPIYTPSGRNPSVSMLCDSLKTDQLIAKIKRSGVSDAEKEFLIKAAQRHLGFNYSLIADYYAGASAEMQSLMEDSALVIIDFDKAIEKGFVKLSKDLKTLYERDKQIARQRKNE